MKKLLSIFVFATLLSIFNSCKSEEEVYYDGDSLIHFDKGQQVNAYVNLGTNNADYLLTYGVTKAAEGNNTVELVFNASKSTAVLGTDFTIVEGSDVLQAGNALGDFKLNIKESAATSNKKAVFTLKSNSLANATFNQEIEVKFNLACPLNNFPLNYNVDVYAFSDVAPSHQQTLTPVPGTDNQFKVNSSWGPNFVAWATGNSGYNNQYLYPGTITINCTEVIYTSDVSYGTGGTGTYDPTTGVIDIVVGQSLFTTPFTANCVFTPL